MWLFLGLVQLRYRIRSQWRSEVRKYMLKDARSSSRFTHGTVALVEPLAVGWHAVNISPYKPGDSVLILGGGPIGLAVIQALKARGAEKIIVSEVAPKRRDFAKQFGAHYVLDPTKDDIVAKVRELCDGQGANVAFDAAGVQAGLNQAVMAIRARGTLVNIAVWEKAATLHPNDLVFKERSYMGVATYVKGDFQDVIDAIASGIQGNYFKRRTRC